MAASGKKRILVVDDEEPMRSLLVKILSKVHEYEVFAAADGVDALDVFEKSGPFDLVITDLQMPRMDGEALASSIHDRWPGTAVIVLTASRGDDSVLKCLRRGVLDYLGKPVDVAKLIKAVDRAFDRHAHMPAQAGDIDVKSDVRGWVELTAPSHFEYVERFQRFTQLLYAAELSREEQEDIHMAITELGQNAVEWGNRHDASKQIRLSYCMFKDRVVFKIEDEGEGFAADSLRDPSKDPLVHIMERISAGKRMGGYGIFMTKSIMDEVLYSERGNTVIMSKSFGPRRRHDSAKDASDPPGLPPGAST